MYFFLYSLKLCMTSKWALGPNPPFYFLPVWMTVFHGDVYCVCPVWCSVAGMVCLLLERSPENSVLDWRCHLPGDA